MSEESKSGPNIVVVTKFLFALMGTLIPASFTIMILDLVPLLSVQLKAQATILAVLCFFAGSMALLFSTPSIQKAIIWLSGFVIAIGAITVAGVQIIVMGVITYPTETLVFVGPPTMIVVVLILRRFPETQDAVKDSPISEVLSLSKITLRGKVVIGGVELSEFPESHLSKAVDHTAETSWHHSFYKILRVMMLARAPLALRIERVKSKTRVLYLTWAKDESDLDANIVTLRDALKGSIPEFRFDVIRRFQGPTINPLTTQVTTNLIGEPLSIEEPTQDSDALTSIVEVLQSMSDGIIQLSATPKRTNERELRSLESSYESELELSETTHSSPKQTFFSGEIQESTKRVNMKAVRRAKAFQKKIDRLKNRHLCEVSVTALCWDNDLKKAERKSKRLIEVAMGAVTPADKEEDLRFETRTKPHEASKLLAGEPIGKSSLCSIEEATVYFILPRCDLGIQATPRARFSTVTSTSESRPIAKRAQKPRGSHKESMGWKYETEGAIMLGNTLNSNGELILRQPVMFRPRLLNSHLGIYGTTRYGKTTTCLSLVAQMYRAGVIPIIIVPYKVDEWRVLKEIIPDLRIFTAGNPEVSPLRYNMFKPPKGVSVSKYLDQLAMVHSAALPNDEVMSMHFDDVFRTVYERKGWKRKGNVHGDPIMLSDLYNAFKEVTSKRIKYGGNTKQDFYGALDARLRSMLSNELIVDMYNTSSGLTIEELLKHPTIIEMDQLADADKTLLSGLLAMGISEYKQTNPTKDVSNVLILEEAHHLLKRIRRSEGAPASAQEVAQESFAIMFRTSGGTGFIIIMLDQLPGSMNPEVVKLHGNVIIHRLTDESERTLVGLQAQCNEEQIHFIGALPIGQAIIRLGNDSAPRHIQVRPLDWHLSPPLRKEGWTNQDIRRTMETLFEQQPELSDSEEIPQWILDELQGVTKKQDQTNIVDGINERTASVLNSLIQNHRFSKLFYKTLRNAAQGDTQPFVLLITKTVNKSTKTDDDPTAVAEWIVSTAWKTFGLPNNESFQKNLIGKVAVELAT